MKPTVIKLSLTWHFVEAEQKLTKRRHAECISHSFAASPTRSPSWGWQAIEDDTLSLCRWNIEVRVIIRNYEQWTHWQDRDVICLVSSLILCPDLWKMSGFLVASPRPVYMEVPSWSTFCKNRFILMWSLPPHPLPLLLHIVLLSSCLHHYPPPPSPFKRKGINVWKALTLHRELCTPEMLTAFP